MADVSRESSKGFSMKSATRGSPAMLSRDAPLAVRTGSRRDDRDAVRELDAALAGQVEVCDDELGTRGLLGEAIEGLDGVRHRHAGIAGASEGANQGPTHDELVVDHKNKRGFHAIPTIADFEPGGNVRRAKRCARAHRASDAASRRAPAPRRRAA